MPDRIRFDDGTELPADVIVYATGYTSMNGFVADLISREMLKRSAKSGGSARTPPRIPAHGKAKSAICGSRRYRKPYGSMAAICINRAITRNSFRCS